MKLDSEQSFEWKLRTKNICFEGQRKIDNILNDNNWLPCYLPDSKESIPPADFAWRAGTTTLFDKPTRQAK